MEVDKKPDEIYCPSCGKPIKKDAVVCPNCGVQVGELKAPVDNETTISVNEKYAASEANSRATTWLIWSIVGFFICGIILGPLSIVQATSIKRILKPDDPGYGKALAAQIIGWVDVSGWIIAVILSIVMGIAASASSYSY
jgi:hypothetical protein